MNIRVEKNSDRKKIWQLNVEAFGANAEANLVDALRISGIDYISLIAEEGGNIVGHILFTPVELTNNQSELKIMGLAPMAVAKYHRQQGIGSQLIKIGLERCVTQGYDAVVVLGHPDYYPKFGFTPSEKYGIKSEYDVPDDVFMILELKKGALNKKQGTIKYHEAFAGV